MELSDSISKLAVASSNTIICLLARTALSKAINCLSPAETFAPLSPTSCSNPSSYLSNQSIKPIFSNSLFKSIFSGFE